VGTPENWHTAFDFRGIWGLKSSQQRYWERISENNDLVFFYATVPVSGVVGYGIVRTKLHQPSPLWPRERAENRVIWPFRFEFDVISAFPPAAWEKQRIVLPELKIRARSGFQEIEAAIAQELLGSLPSNAPRDLVLPHAAAQNQPFPSPPQTPIPAPSTAHERGQWLLAEIGRMQKFIADTEYPLENRRLDVVWRRVQRSVPSYVFEVQVSGNLTEAVGKLKQAFELWNSNVFLVSSEEHRSSTNQLLEGTFREMRPRLRFVELRQVEELYQRKRAYRELEGQLGMF
jgi:hypothetical protein